VHCTDVVPCANSDPDWRVQLTCTGARPPLGEASPNETLTPAGTVADALTLDGHVIASAGGGDGGGGVGPFGELHATAHIINAAHITARGNFIISNHQFYRVLGLVQKGVNS
jgi:hypothetical protein